MNDIIDKKSKYYLLKELNSRSKPNFKKISEKLNVSRKTLLTYFNILKDEKIISNFTININPNIQPNLKYALLEIKTNPKEPQLIKELLKIPQLKMLDGILGEFSLMALFIFKNSEEFNTVLNIIDKIMAFSYFKKYQIIEPIRVFKTNGIELSKTKLTLFELEKKDFLILKILQEEQGQRLMSTYEIKNILNNQYNQEISQATIYNRIKKFEESGIILNYTINFCPMKLGFKGKYIIRIKPKDPSKYTELSLNLEKMSEIIDLFRIGEQYGLMAIIRVKKVEDYGIFIKNLYDSEEIEDTFTNFVLDEWIPFTNYIIH